MARQAPTPLKPVEHTPEPDRNIPFGRPIIGKPERDVVMTVMEGTTLTHGPLVRQFESNFAEFTGADHAVAMSSCAAALHTACLGLGIGEGDEVLVAAQTHVATAHAVELCGARCVFVDAEPHTGNIDPELLEPAITPRTRAIMVVHYAGWPAPMPRIMEIAREHDLAVIEDCALALGTTIDGTHVGLFGDAGCFSFYPVKHITTGEGGMLITKREDLAGSVSQYRAFGIDRNVVSERPVPGMYDVHVAGLNYRMNEIAAGMGIVQLQRLPGFLEARRLNFTLLSSALGDLDHLAVLGASHSVEHASCYCLVAMLDGPLSRRRIELIAALKARGVGTSIYYPQPVPRMTYYRERYQTPPDQYAVASRISDQSLALPVGPHVTPEDIDYIAASMAAAIEEAL